MFKSFHGFHLVEAYHQAHHDHKYHPNTVEKKFAKALIVTIVTLFLWNVPASFYGIDGLTVIQQRIIAIFAFATLMWVMEVVSSWATSLGIIVLMLLCTSDSGFVLAIAAAKTGLDAYLAKALLKPFGRKSENVLLGFILVTGLFSMFVSNTATAAMMLAFLTPVFKQLPPEGKGRIALALSIPVAANLGGMGTPIGTPPNNIALKYLNDPDGLNLGLGFGEWMLIMVPLVAVLLFISWGLLKTIFPFSQKTVDLEIEGEMKKGKNTTIVIITFIITVLLWLTDSITGINSNTVALIPVGVFAMTGVLTKYDLEEINWSVLWMVAGGFALGYGLNASGLAENAVKTIPFGDFSPFLILVISGVICYILSNFISNSATAALLMPILAVVCSAMGDKLAAIGGTPTVLIGVAIAASSAMILPVSTPPNALAFSTNLVQQKDMVKIGVIVGIISMVLGYGLMYFVGKSGLL